MRKRVKVTIVLLYVSSTKKRGTPHYRRRLLRNGTLSMREKEEEEAIRQLQPAQHRSEYFENPVCREGRSHGGAASYLCRRRGRDARMWASSEQFLSTEDPASTPSKRSCPRKNPRSSLSSQKFLGSRPLKLWTSRSILRSRRCLESRGMACSLRSSAIDHR